MILRIQRKDQTSAEDNVLGTAFIINAFIQISINRDKCKHVASTENSLRNDTLESGFFPVTMYLPIMLCLWRNLALNGMGSSIQPPVLST